MRKFKIVFTRVKQDLAKNLNLSQLLYFIAISKYNLKL